MEPLQGEDIDCDKLDSFETADHNRLFEAKKSAETAQEYVHAVIKENLGDSPNDCDTQRVVHLLQVIDSFGDGIEILDKKLDSDLPF